MARVKDSGQYKRHMQIRIGADLHKEAVALAKRHGKTLSQLVRELLQHAVDRSNRST